MKEKTFFIDDVAVKSNIDNFNLASAQYCIRSIVAEEHMPIQNVCVTETGNNEWLVEYDVIQPKFERIRRITGYLVGTLDRWNNSKRAEESERVKHI